MFITDQSEANFTDCVIKENRAGRGLHSFTFRLNLSTLCGIGGACRGCSVGVYGDFGGMRDCVGCILCQNRLRLS